jgi:hypothetical protein
MFFCQLEQGYPAHLAAAGTLGRGKGPLLPGLDDVYFAIRFAGGRQRPRSTVSDAAKVRAQLKKSHDNNERLFTTPWSAVAER